MGYWGTDLLSNDYVQDALFDFEHIQTDSDGQSVIARYFQKAAKESSTFMLTEDDLPLIYDEKDKASLLFNDEQETIDRDVFLGLIAHGLENKGFLKYFTKDQLQFSLGIVKQLCNKRLLDRWEKSPQERFKSLFEFQEKLNTHIQSL